MGPLAKSQYCSHIPARQVWSLRHIKVGVPPTFDTLCAHTAVRRRVLNQALGPFKGLSALVQMMPDGAPRVRMLVHIMPDDNQTLFGATGAPTGGLDEDTNPLTSLGS